MRRKPADQWFSPPGVQAEGKPPDQTTLNRMYVVEPSPTPTGGMADHRIVLRAVEVEAFASELSAAIGGGGNSSGKYKEVAAIARDLQAHRGTCVVVAGPNQPPNVHALAHAMNQALGNVGKTVTYTDPIEANPVDQRQSLAELVTDMNAGKVDSLLILGGNPVYAAPVDLDFAAALKKVNFRAYLSLFPDETSALVNWHIPEAHYLESWSDVRGYDGTVSIVQPLIAPLYGGKTAHEIIATLSGQPGKTSHELVQENWQTPSNSASFDIFWQWALCHDGVGLEYRAARHQCHRQGSGQRSVQSGPGPRDSFPPRSCNLGWIVGQQRLAPGIAQAAKQDDLGQRRVDQPHHGAAAQPQHRGNDRAEVPGPQHHVLRYG